MATTETMSITRGLAELKSIQGRIDRAIQSAQWLALAQGRGTNRRLVGAASGTIESASEKIVANYASVVGLLARYRAIKSAVVQANATTLVNIAGESMPIAVAIERKNSITFERNLVASMKTSWNQHSQCIASAEQKLQQQIDTVIGQVLGNDRAKITEEQIRTVTDPKRNEFEPSLVDPLNVSAKIEELENKIDAFLTEVDFALSEINAKTEITVTY